MGSYKGDGKPQYRTLVKALTSLSNAVHDEFDQLRSPHDIRRKLRQAMEQADKVIVRAEEVMAQRRTRRKEARRQAITNAAAGPV